jgi:hypothetical protein
MASSNREGTMRYLAAAAGALLLACTVLCTGCGGCEGDSAAIDPALGAQVLDFALVDVNPNSATHLASVSPRDYVGRISAWYFGHAT